MNILVTLDSNYVFPLTVLLKSIMITNINNTFDIYVAHCSLTENDFCNIKNLLIRFAQKFILLRFRLKY